jgi:tetratricopeptide (TPR) repeat protein
MLEHLNRKWLIFGVVMACVFSFVLSAPAQSKFPTPAEVKKRVEDQPILSETYQALNYSANAVKQPGYYPGRMEGGPPDPKIVKRTLDEDLPRANQAIADEPSDTDRGSYYEYRGEIYCRYFEITEDHAARAEYAAKALADLNKAIALDPKLADAYEKRAGLIAVVDFFGYFDLFMADFAEAIRLLAADPANAEKVNWLKSWIAQRYYNRAQALSVYPELLAEVRRLHKQYADYTPWKDLDTALAYAKEMPELFRIRSSVGYLSEKMQAAFRLGRYDLALKALNDRKEFWDKACAGSAGADIRACVEDKDVTAQNLERDFAKAYIKLKKFDTALPYLNSYLARRNNDRCPEPFLVRAKVYRQLGKWELVTADEKTAREKSDAPFCYDMKEEWDGWY